MTYNELQAKAAELGMEKVVGKKTEELEAFIASKENAENTPQSTNTTATPTEPTENTGSPSVDKQPQPEYTLATVFNGANQVRAFDLQTHGEKFAELAEGFASKFKYRVEMGFIAGKIECPNCGTKFNK